MLPTPNAIESRAHKRYPCRVHAWCQPASANEWRWDATIEDISYGGIRLRLRRRFEPQTGLTIELAGRAGGEPCTIFARVVHVRSVGVGVWVIGCQLLDDLTPEELKRLARLRDSDVPAPPAAAPAPERTTVHDLRLWVGTLGGQLVAYRVKRFQVKGAWPLAPGTSIDLRGIVPFASRAACRYQVVQCARQGDGWALQVRPVEEPAPAGLPVIRQGSEGPAHDPCAS
jgi:hypothetical protein